MTSELAFRAQVILREQRELFAYWRRCAKGARLPCREDIDPVAIPHLLPYLSIFDAEHGLDAIRYRLAGTAVCQIFGEELTGVRVFSLAYREKHGYWREVYRELIEKGRPLQGLVRGPVANREHLVLSWLRLPLGNEKGRVDKILGYDSAVALPPAIPLRQSAQPSHGS